MSADYTKTQTLTLGHWTDMPVSSCISFAGGHGNELRMPAEQSLNQMSNYSNAQLKKEMHIGNYTLIEKLLIMYYTDLF